MSTITHFLEKGLQASIIRTYAWQGGCSPVHVRDKYFVSFTYGLTSESPVCQMENRFVEKATGAIADKYRLAILQELSRRGSLTSTDVQELTGLSQPCVSHHVRQLTESGLVNAQKEGRNLHLTLNRASLQQLSGFLETLL